MGLSTRCVSAYALELGGRGRPPTLPTCMPDPHRRNRLFVGASLDQASHLPGALLIPASDMALIALSRNGERLDDAFHGGISELGSRQPRLSPSVIRMDRFRAMAGVSIPQQSSHHHSRFAAEAEYPCLGKPSDSHLFVVNSCAITRRRLTPDWRSSFKSMFQATSVPVLFAADSTFRGCSIDTCSRVSSRCSTIRPSACTGSKSSRISGRLRGTSAMKDCSLKEFTRLYVSPHVFGVAGAHDPRPGSRRLANHVPSLRTRTCESSRRPPSSPGASRQQADVNG